jgi:IclR family pca regulon transcriptional regulator
MTARADLPNKGLPKGSDTFVEAFARGLAVIKAFEGASGPLTLSEVAARADMAPAGARRLLHTLVTLGYARFDNKRFSLTARVLELGSTYLSALSGREEARAIIDNLARETGEVCTLSVLQGTDVVYLVRAELRSPLTRSLGVGERLPTHATSSGHVLLAGLAPDALDAFLDNAPFQRYTPRTRCKRREVLEAAEFARENGWAIASEELELGVCGLAVPVRNLNGETVAALTISVNLARHNESEVRKRLLPRLLSVSREFRME